MPENPVNLIRLECATGTLDNQINSAPKAKSLYEHVNNIAPASYDDDPMEIQKKLRDEWS